MAARDAAVVARGRCAGRRMGNEEVRAKVGAVEERRRLSVQEKKNMPSPLPFMLALAALLSLATPCAATKVRRPLCQWRAGAMGAGMGAGVRAHAPHPPLGAFGAGSGSMRRGRAWGAHPCVTTTTSSPAPPPLPLQVARLPGQGRGGRG